MMASSNEGMQLTIAAAPRYRRRLQLIPSVNPDPQVTVR
jgi:hypothetical protein